MNKLKLTALLTVLFSSALFFFSCEKTNSADSTGIMTTTDSLVTRSQVIVPPTVPLPPSPGSGTIKGSYDKSTKLFTYTVTWNNLSDSAIAVHIHGLAERGTLAIAPYPMVSPFVGAIIQNFTTGVPRRRSGSFSSTLYMDGIVLKENDLLEGKYYVDVHTKPAPFSATGEIRGQIVFN
jgi:hypothetical protein